MNPQPPVTKMRIGALPSSGDETARGEIQTPLPLAERLGADRLDLLGNHRLGRVSPLSPLEHEAAPFRRGDQRLVRRSDDEERVLSLRPDQLSRSAAFLYSVPLAGALRSPHLGASAAGRAGQHRFDFRDAEVRAFRRPNGQPDRGARDGNFAGLYFLRALLDPRSVAVAFLDALRARAARALALRDPRLPLVCRNRHRRDDPDEGDLHHPHRLRADRGGCALGFAQ